MKWLWLVLVLLISTPAVAEVSCPEGGLVGTITATGDAASVGPFSVRDSPHFTIQLKNTGAGTSTTDIQDCCTNSCVVTAATDWLNDLDTGLTGKVAGAGASVLARPAAGVRPACQLRARASACTTCNVQVWLRCVQPDN